MCVFVMVILYIMLSGIPPFGKVPSSSSPSSFFTLRAIRWCLKSTPISMPPKSGCICGRLTQDLPLGYLQVGITLKPRGG